MPTMNGAALCLQECRSSKTRLSTRLNIAIDKVYYTTYNIQKRSIYKQEIHTKKKIYV